MGIEEILMALTTAGRAVSGIADLIAKHEAKIVALEAQVQAHDKLLTTAPPPGLPEHVKI